MLVRGKTIILTIALLTIGAAAFAWWFNVQASRRSVEFWGRPTAEVLRGAAQVDLLRFGSNGPSSPFDGAPVNSVTVKLGDQEFFVVERKTLVRVRGEFSDLIEDRSYAWDRPAKPVAPREAGQLLGLEFKGENSTVTILVDLKTDGVFNLTTGAAVFLTDDFASQIRDLERKQFAPARDERPKRGETP